MRPFREVTWHKRFWKQASVADTRIVLNLLWVLDKLGIRTADTDQWDCAVHNGELKVYAVVGTKSQMIPTQAARGPSVP